MQQVAACFRRDQAGRGAEASAIGGASPSASGHRRRRASILSSVRRNYTAFSSLATRNAHLFVGGDLDWLPGRRIATLCRRSGNIDRSTRLTEHLLTHRLKRLERHRFEVWIEGGLIEQAAEFLRLLEMRMTATPVPVGSALPSLVRTRSDRANHAACGGQVRLPQLARFRLPHEYRSALE